MPASSFSPAASAISDWRSSSRRDSSTWSRERRARGSSPLWSFAPARSAAWACATCCCSSARRIAARSSMEAMLLATVSEELSLSSRRA